MFGSTADDGRVELEGRRGRSASRFPTGHPYAKWTGTHWRLVEVADAGVAGPRESARRGQSKPNSAGWSRDWRRDRVLRVAGPRSSSHSSIEGNAVYALSRLGYADEHTHPGSWSTPCLIGNGQTVAGTVTATATLGARRSTSRPYLPWVWRHTDKPRSTEEPFTPPSAPLNCCSSIGCSGRCPPGEPIHPSWTVLHYPPYWHYDVLLGLRLLDAVALLSDPRASGALRIVERAQRSNGRFSGRSWSSSRQPSAADWGRGTEKPPPQRVRHGGPRSRYEVRNSARRSVSSDVVSQARRLAERRRPGSTGGRGKRNPVTSRRLPPAFRRCGSPSLQEGPHPGNLRLGCAGFRLTGDRQVLSDVDRGAGSRRADGLSASSRRCVAANG